jgi:hypothetical protein
MTKLYTYHISDIKLANMFKAQILVDGKMLYNLHDIIKPRLEQSCRSLCDILNKQNES